LAAVLPEITDLINALAWPLVVLIAIAVTVSESGQRAVGRLGSHLRRFRLGSLELEFTEQRARVVRETLEQIFTGYRARAKDEFDGLARTLDVRRLMDTVASEAIQPALIKEAQKDFRCTVYVQDLVFEEALYQLLDYFPKGGGRGRIITKRFGLVGRAFRAEDSQIDGDVPATELDLVVHWGMTRGEALRSGRDRRSFACVVLKGETNNVVGGIYIDAFPPHAFGSDRQTFEERVVDAARESGLTSALEAIASQVRSRGPDVEIFSRD
jgi:hypothetical protein